MPGKTKATGTGTGTGTRDEKAAIEVRRLQRVDRAARALVKRFVDPANRRCLACVDKHGQLSGHFQSDGTEWSACPIEVLEKALETPE